MGPPGFAGITTTMILKRGGAAQSPRPELNEGPTVLFKKYAGIPV